MRKVALTGNIGSGKSLVAKLFSILGVPIYNADEESKKLLSTDAKLKASLITEFGDIYSEQGLNKKKFAAILFSDSSAREKANRLIHPVVRSHFDAWAAEKNADYCIQEAAILMETGAIQYFDTSIVVSSPKEIRLQRVMKRDNSSESEVLARMDAQWSDAKKEAMADHVIYNDGEHSLILQVLALHQSFISPIR